ncbi:MAG: hypothetical protein U1E76_09750 [Planctomycetota bacterium]
MELPGLPQEPLVRGGASSDAPRQQTGCLEQLGDLRPVVEHGVGPGLEAEAVLLDRPDRAADARARLVHGHAPALPRQPERGAEAADAGADHGVFDSLGHARHLRARQRPFKSAPPRHTRFSRCPVKQMF